MSSEQSYNDEPNPPGAASAEVSGAGHNVLGQDVHLAARVYRIPPHLVTPEAVQAAVVANPNPLIAAYGLEFRRARTDSVTGLLNREAFNEHFMRLTPEELRASGIFALVLVDVDGFKTVNDTAGYAEGDRLLLKLGEKLRIVDLLFRLGGDEYAALLVDGEPQEGDSLLSAEQRLNVVEARMTDEADRLFTEQFSQHSRLGVSIGSVAVSDELHDTLRTPGGEVSPSDIFALANGALKLAKKANEDAAARGVSFRVRAGRWLGRLGYRLSREYDRRIMP